MDITLGKVSNDIHGRGIGTYTNEVYPDFGTVYDAVKAKCAKDVKVGDIVYWVERVQSQCIKTRLEVVCGIIDEVYHDCYVGSHLDYTRYVKFKLWNEQTEKVFTDKNSWREYFKNVSWRKYPSKKELADSNKLFEYSVEPVYSLAGSKLTDLPNLKDKDAIKKAMDDGILCRRQDVITFNLCPYTEIEKGSWRPVLKYGDEVSQNDYLAKSMVFSTYDDAQKLVDAIRQEYAWVASLTDREYSLLEMDKTLNHLVRGGMDESDARRIADHMIKMKNIEEMEFRPYLGKFQWRYYDRPKWLTVNPENILPVDDEV